MPGQFTETTTDVKKSTKVVTRVLLGVGIVVSLFIIVSIVAGMLGSSTVTR